MGTEGLKILKIIYKKCFSQYFRAKTSLKSPSHFYFYRKMNTIKTVFICWLNREFLRDTKENKIADSMASPISPQSFHIHDHADKAYEQKHQKKIKIEEVPVLRTKGWVYLSNRADFLLTFSFRFHVGRFFG